MIGGRVPDNRSRVIQVASPNRLAGLTNQGEVSFSQPACNGCQRMAGISDAILAIPECAPALVGDRSAIGAIPRIPIKTMHALRSVKNIRTGKERCLGLGIAELRVDPPTRFGIP